jgi:hypothetical protein
MQDNATQKNKYDAMVHLWPITVEIYPTGKVAFIARPGGRGKRWNKTFSTSSFSSPEEASTAAINFCKRVIAGTDEEIKYIQKAREQQKLARYRMTEEEYQLHFEAKKLQIDVMAVLRREIRAKWEGRK